MSAKHTPRTFLKQLWALLVGRPTAKRVRRLRLGQRVVRKGFERLGTLFEGTVTAVYAGKLDGMVEVRLLNQGSTFVDRADKFIPVRQ